MNHKHVYAYIFTLFLRLWLNVNCGTAVSGSGVEAADWHWVVGVLCQIVSAGGTCIGLVLQKLAHNREQAKPPEERAMKIFGLPMTMYWGLAILLMVFIPLPFDIISFGLMAQFIIVTFAGLTLVFTQVYNGSYDS